MQTKRTFMTDSFTISYENVKTGWNMPFIHHHSSYELYVLESGRRIVTIDGCEYVAEAYDVTLFAKDIPHTSRGSTPFSGICIHILDSFLDYHFTEASKQQLLRCFKTPVVRLDKTEFLRIKQFSDEFKVSSENNLFVFIHIMDILRTACARCGKTAMLPHKKPETKAQCIIKYVDENYTSINSVNEILEKFSVSEGYIFKVFRQSCNTTPKKYLHMLKLNNVRRLLENSHGSIRSIAEKSGFECYEYFIRLFKREFNCTPSEYRQRYINKK